ncbi:phosphodiester glycosidase family protein [Paracoccus ravus]|uniref:phosphodiester glycosidase family protein n=1 Tax=Paracoccus ravus TaxID=2447760 RepID=UPI00106E70C0|nr:phosphodiester glycosidase family protein [Paracoccus ravus]
MRIDLKRRLGLALGALVAMTLPAMAGICEKRDFDGQGYVICTLDARQEPGLKLWLNDADGRVLGDFYSVRKTLGADEVLGFAMNAGMYHEDYSPVGLYISDGNKEHDLVTAGGGGNFGMLPNGVFCTGGKRPYQVVESRAFKAAAPQCRIATQSGPMLVIDGKLHPRFLVDSDSRYIRNGVGVSPDGQTAWFAISDRAVTFHEFGRLFKDGLGARDALYFDGSISRLYSPEMRRSDFGRRLGPIIGYTGKN